MKNTSFASIYALQTVEVGFGGLTGFRDDKKGTAVPIIIQSAVAAGFVNLLSAKTFLIKFKMLTSTPTLLSRLVQALQQPVAGLPLRPLRLNKPSICFKKPRETSE